MAIPSNPSRTQIFAEFSGGVQQNVINNRSLAQMYSIIFGAGNHSRDAFGGKSASSITSTSESNGSPTAGGATKQIFIELGNGITGTTAVRVKYHKDDGNVPFSGQTISTTSWSSGHISGSFVQIDLSNLDWSSTYFYRVEHYNAFGSSTYPFTYSEMGGTENFTTQAQPTMTTPSILSAWHGYGVTYTCEWNYSSLASTFESQYRINGGLWTNTNSLQSSTNWGSSSNPKSATWMMNQFMNIGDTLEVRIRAKGTGIYNDSAWSAAEEAIFV